MSETTNISIGGIGTAILFVGMFWVAYQIDHENKEYCIHSNGSVEIYDRDMIFDDWTCAR